MFIHSQLYNFIRSHKKEDFSFVVTMVYIRTEI